MTIAGSDSGGGAGIQADLKTFAAFQVLGTTAITAITAQNTYSVTGIQAIDLDIIEKQIRAVAEDMGIDAAKTGMLFSSDIIKRVSDVLDDYDFPLVVDPVMIAKSGAELLKPDAVDSLIKLLLPRATVITPNAREAGKLSGISVVDVDSAKKAAKKISSMGSEAVVVKGGHLSGEISLDILYYKGEYRVFESPRYESRSIHGTGCSFSAAIAAGLARGWDVVESVRVAKEFISNAIRFGLLNGKGYGPVNPMAIIYREATRLTVLKELSLFVDWLSRLKGIEGLVPEVGMNVAYSTIYPLSKDDIAAIPGRIRRVPGGGITFMNPTFGSSDHLARYILRVREYDESIRCAINIRYDKRIIDLLSDGGFKVSYYDRKVEPGEIKKVEGRTVEWGVDQAIKRLGRVPDVIYHLGDVGKEPMIVLLAKELDGIKEMLRCITGVAVEG
jgi:hydroxymethylpyrimidine/phosphomethylpyrimidine kinase